MSTQAEHVGLYDLAQWNQRRAEFWRKIAGGGSQPNGCKCPECNGALSDIDGPRIVGAAQSVQVHVRVRCFRCGFDGTRGL